MYKYRNPHNPSKQQTVILLATAAELLFSIVVIYLITVTFGASIYEDFLRTLIFSVLMTGLCIAPTLFLVEHNNPFALLFRVLIQHDCRNNDEYRCMKTSMYAVTGAWLGALVIPLDWDRWWQEWPLSCSFGAIFGAFLGLSLAIKFGKGKKSYM